MIFEFFQTNIYLEENLLNKKKRFCRINQLLFENRTFSIRSYYYYLLSYLCDFMKLGYIVGRRMGQDEKQGLKLKYKYNF